MFEVEKTIQGWEYIGTRTDKDCPKCHKGKLIVNLVNDGWCSTNSCAYVFKPNNTGSRSQ